MPVSLSNLSRLVFFLTRYGFELNANRITRDFGIDRLLHYSDYIHGCIIRGFYYYMKSHFHPRVPFNLNPPFEFLQGSFIFNIVLNLRCNFGAHRQSFGMPGALRSQNYGLWGTVPSDISWHDHVECTEHEYEYTRIFVL